MHARTVEEAGRRQEPVVILVHGLVVASSSMVPLLRRLAPWCRVYAPDLPGYGSSIKFRHAPTLPALAGYLDAWMSANRIGRASLVGNSYGCNVIAEFFPRYPERVEKAVLLGPTTDPKTRSLWRQLFRLLRAS